MNEQEILTMINASFDEGKVLSSAQVGKIHEFMDKNTKKIKAFEKQIESLEEDVDLMTEERNIAESDTNKMMEERDEAQEELERVKEFLPSATLEDENKNKILASLNKNLSLLQLENVEALVKKMINEQGKQYVEATF